VTFLSEIKGVLSATDAGRANAAHDFAIVAESDDFIVVEKPPFLLVHPTKPTGARTLWGELKHLLAFEIANGGQVSIVNRLDRETSGLVLVAKNAAAARRFGVMMQEQRIAKEYIAIVWGWPEWNSKTVDSPLARQGIHAPSPIWLKQAIHPAGVPARTEFTTERRFCRGATDDRFSIIRAIPQTGRTHQIRVHLASLDFIAHDRMKHFTSSSSRPAGRRNLRTGFFSRAMHFIPLRLKSRAVKNGPVRCLLISIVF